MKKKLETDENRFLKNNWKWMEMFGNGRKLFKRVLKWLKTDGNGRKRLNMVENG